MTFGGLSPLVAIGLIVLAIAFGVLVALIAIELRKRSQRSRRPDHRRSPMPTHSDEEKKRRQDLVVNLMALYSGVHSADALSHFLNKELEHRHEPWRVRVPPDGPGEIYDLEPF